MPRLRLFHFDIPTNRNHGDTLLFDAVRHVFRGVASGDAFEVYGTAPLRDEVTPGLIDTINASADAVLVGGGGLFLADTCPNPASGWQWNISLEQLRRLQKPLIVFAVGNNRFIGQPDFADPFREHLALTVEKSVFFGLRNRGSVRTIAEYLPPSLRERVVYQPCPTTLGSWLYPDLVRPRSDRRELAVQQLIGVRQARAGFSRDRIGRASVEALRRLHAEGWRLHGTPFARADGEFDDLLGSAGLRDASTALHGPGTLYRGPELFADLPVIFGTRGHAQMIPFGMGCLPISAMVHDKLRYFAEDIGRPGWVVDPRDDDFATRLYTVINEAYEARADERDQLTAVRRQLVELTLANVAVIHRRVAGSPLPPGDFVPHAARERRRVEELHTLTARAVERRASRPSQPDPPKPPAAREPVPAPVGFRAQALALLPGWSRHRLRRLRRRLTNH